MKKRAFIEFYYAILLFLLIETWASTSLASLPVRVLYLGLLFLPLLSNREFLAPCLILFWTTAQLSFGYSLMPTESYYYVAITLVFVAVTLLRNKKPIRFPYPLLFLFFLFVVLVNLATNGELQKVSYSSILFLLLLLTINDNLSEVTEMIGYAFILVTLICSILVLINLSALTISYSSDLDRVMTGSINYSCSTLGIGSVIALSQSLNVRKNWWWRIVCIITIIISLFVLVIQASRGAILAVAVADIAILLFQRIKLIYKLLGIALVVAFVFFLYDGSYMDLLIYRIQTDDGAGTNRLVMWEQKLSAFQESANVFHYLFGIGFENAWKLGGAGKAYVGCHNDFLAFFIEYGIFGFIMFLGMILYPLYCSPRNARISIIPLFLFIVSDCISLEPYSMGYPPMYCLLLYIYLLSASKRDISS